MEFIGSVTQTGGNTEFVGKFWISLLVCGEHRWHDTKEKLMSAHVYNDVSKSLIF